MDGAHRPLAAIDWSRPWFAPWRDPGQRVAARVCEGEPLHEALNREQGAPVRFVPQQALPDGRAYEHFISASGQCPVRPGLHDFFNGLAWLALPLSKARLNRLQAAQIEERGVGAVRGPVRDAITLFDENGALLDAPPELWAALLERDWQRLFVQLRPLWRQARLLVVGHALLEKLVQPRKALTAHLWRSPVALQSVAAADALLAAMLTPAVLAAKPFTPLPLLGIPGWSAQNADVCFYDDAQVFRPRRAPERTTTPPLHPRAHP
ncbi:DUF3025 domain-containing protein [Caenimonas terrae]|uniref:DUF3025 domain-containing protein n=1 Tax=Caenimonas terrae TaxID=696074 RepID=A0ABW0NF50_9BURK